ncbi:TonB-dependent receptor domain-containing protein [Pasteurella bettyae]|uniref:TonB-dependent receptor domain-containing protein n=1 Tax=Pasteurella bettyae TaxID=752 RepID=UPI003D2E66A6
MLMKGKLSTITLCIFSYCQFSYAEHSTSTSLDTIQVSAEAQSIHDEVQSHKVGETVKTAKTLSKQQVGDAKDLVRYDPGVTVVEAGRFGQSGFAVRGVEENRVAIQIDGLTQAETISSQGFKELFEGYGNFNNTRNSAEIETLKQVTIHKGANSIKAGSGALGGSVVFETKDARDFLTEKNYHFSYKRGYQSASNQNLNTFTAAGRYKWFDFLVVRTERKGHEEENYGYRYYDGNIQGRQREKADPYRRKLESTLLKLSFQPNENNRLTVAADLYDATSKGHDFSYTLKSSNLIKDCKDAHCIEKELRHTNDQVKRKNYSFVYENYSSNPFYDTLRVAYSNQHIRTRARTDDYCDGNANCQGFSNPLGLHFNENNQLVGNDNKPVEYKNTPAVIGKETIFEEKVFKSNVYWLFNPEIKKYQEELRTKYNTKQVSYDHSTNEKGEDVIKYEVTKSKEISPADKHLTINGKTYKDEALQFSPVQFNSTYTSLILACDQAGGVNCQKDTVEAFGPDGTIKHLPFTVETLASGEKVAKITAQNEESADTAPSLILPVGKGYLENIWTERDLNTMTQQVNLDLTKYLQIGSTEHNLSYGGLWSNSKKEMVNHSGDNAIAKGWWALYPTDCQNSTDKYNSLCNNRNTYSFLIPVKTKTVALYFADDARVNQYWGFDWAYRYDRIKHSPEYIPGVTPKIPDGMVNDLYTREPNFNRLNYTDPANDALRTANANANIREIAKRKKFSASSYSLGLTLDPLDWLKIQAKYSKGFRAPAGDEIYFTFLHPDFSIEPNRDLEAETAKTKELAFTFYKPFGYLMASVFRTDYNNYIDLAFKCRSGENGCRQLSGRGLGYPLYKNVNRPSAKVTGFELQSKFLLGEITPRLTGFSVGYKFTYQKGKMAYDPNIDKYRPTDGYIPMNAIQPPTSVINLSYVHPDNYFGVDFYMTHVSHKKEKDTYNRYHGEQQAANSYMKWRSDAYTLFDVVGFVKPIKNLTLQAGLYNLTNQKYATWDSIRSIKPFGTSNLINQNTGAGINRFYSPGRNFRLSAEVIF